MRSRANIRHLEGRQRKKRKSAAHETGATDDKNLSANNKNGNALPELGDGWTNVEWTILEHTHDHIRNLGEESPMNVDVTRVAEEFLKIYESSEYRIKAEDEGKERKEFSKDEVRDRIIALRKTRDRRRSGELPAEKLGNPGAVTGENTTRQRLSGLLNLARFW